MKLEYLNTKETFLYRSRPVVRVTASVELETENGKIDPENRTCTLHSKSKSKTMVSCLSLKGCLVYEGAAVTEELGKPFLFKHLLTF
jgi:hypothetical protein